MAGATNCAVGTFSLIKLCLRTRLVCAPGAFCVGALHWLRRASYHAGVSLKPVFMEGTPMVVRRLRATDLEQASAVCMASFMEAVAPSLSQGALNASFPAQEQGGATFYPFEPRMPGQGADDAESRRLLPRQ